MSELREVLDEHFWHPPVPNPEHPMHRGGCYCGWQCKRIFGESRIDQYIDHLADAIRAHLAEVAGRDETRAAVARAINDADNAALQATNFEYLAATYNEQASAAVGAFLQSIGADQ